MVSSGTTVWRSEGGEGSAHSHGCGCQSDRIFEARRDRHANSPGQLAGLWSGFAPCARGRRARTAAGISRPERARHRGGVVIGQAGEEEHLVSGHPRPGGGPPGRSCRHDHVQTSRSRAGCNASGDNACFPAASTPAALASGISRSTNRTACGAHERTVPSHGDGTAADQRRGHWKAGCSPAAEGQELLVSAVAPRPPAIRRGVDGAPPTEVLARVLAAAGHHGAGC
jgi:hypothetical protein